MLLVVVGPMVVGDMDVGILVDAEGVVEGDAVVGAGVGGNRRQSGNIRTLLVLSDGIIALLDPLPV